MDRDVVSSAGRLQRWWVALTAALLCIACGGGVGTGGTGAFASGPITGFGSIIVSDVHFDESAARIEGDDGSARDRSELHLGTMVEVESGEIRDNAAAASQVRLVSALIGAVQSVTSSTLLVNGQTVRIDVGTLFDDRFVGGLGAIAVGRVVEVYGFVVRGGAEVIATRIEPKDGATTFKFRGVVAALDTQARTFDIGTQHFTYAGQAGGSGELHNGALVRVVVGTQPDAQGRWVASAVGNTGPGGGDRDQFKAKGMITSYTSNASFTVDAYRVDASAARIENGPLALGRHVKVEGSLRSGVLVATEVKVLGPNQQDELQLRGPITSIDTAAKVFQVGGHSERVSYARPDVEYERGTAADLQLGRRVRVTGLLSADGTLLEATRIRLDN
jgi:hypothetical protein